MVVAQELDPPSRYLSKEHSNPRTSSATKWDHVVQSKVLGGFCSRCSRLVGLGVSWQTVTPFAVR